MKRLSVKQVNNLITGTSLSIELPSSSENLRAFLTIYSYMRSSDGGIAGSRVSKVLNSNKEGLRFSFRKYEIDKSYIENDWDIAPEDLANSILKTDIESIEDLEKELSEFLDDFSELDVEWRCDNPL
ncbi:hypothetical protein [Splendidivirga corallicola]